MFLEVSMADRWSVGTKTRVAFCLGRLNIWNKWHQAIAKRLPVMRLGVWGVDFRSPGSHFIKVRDWVVIKEGFHKEYLKPG